MKKVYSISKKVLLVVLVYGAIISIFLHFFAKNKPQYPKVDLTQRTRTEIYKTLKNPTLNATKTGRITVAVYRSMICGMTGEACTNNPEDGDKYAKNSVMGFMSRLLTTPFVNPPASGVYWAYDGLQKSGFIPKSYAAEGIGFGSLKPIMNLWKVFRDISYLILVLVLVSIGFMVMFRTKINPQTVISAENALPKIAVSLILITFSFAIAGFLVDLMYTAIVVVVALLGDNNANYNIADYQSKYLTASMGTIYTSLFPAHLNTGFSGMLGIGNLTLTGNAIASLLPGWINGVFRILAGIVGIVALNSSINNVIEWSKAKNAVDNITILGNTVGTVPSGLIGSILVTLVLAITTPMAMIYGLGLFLGLLVWFSIVFLMFRIFFMLFRSYLQIIFMVVVSPIILLIEAVPGKSTFSYWLKNMIGELITFPVVVTVFLIGNIMVNNLAYPGDFWIPPFLFGIDPYGFSVILGMGFMFLIPDLVKMVKEAVGAKGLPVTIGIGTFFGAASAGVGGGMSLLSQISTLSMASTAITGKSLNQLAKDMKGPAVGQPKKKGDPDPPNPP